MVLSGVIAHGRGWWRVKGKVSKNSRKWHLLEMRLGHASGEMAQPLMNSYSIGKSLISGADCYCVSIVVRTSALICG